MNEKKKSGVTLPEKIEELSDVQLSQTNGGSTFPLLPRPEKPIGLKFGQALKENTSFSKADDHLP